MDLLTEVNDVLLERAGISLDVAKGVKQEQSELQLATVSKQIDTIWNRKVSLILYFVDSYYSFSL